MIHKNRGNRRKQNARKALRKQRISREIFDCEMYDNLHEYDKNKVHCSCPMCKDKTNTSKDKSHGPTDQSRPYSTKIPTTNDRYGKKNYKISDRKKIDDMREQERDFLPN